MNLVYSALPNGKMEYILARTDDYNNYMKLGRDELILFSRFHDMYDAIQVYARDLQDHWRSGMNGLYWDEVCVVFGYVLTIKLEFIMGIDDYLLLAFKVDYRHLVFILVYYASLRFVASYSSWYDSVNPELFAPYILRIKELDFTM